MNMNINMFDEIKIQNKERDYYEKLNEFQFRLYTNRTIIHGYQLNLNLNIQMKKNFYFYYSILFHSLLHIVNKSTSKSKPKLKFQFL